MHYINVARRRNLDHGQFNTLFIWKLLLYDKDIMVKKKDKQPEVIYVPSYPTAGRPLKKDEWTFVQDNLRKFNEATKKTNKKV